jgi:hypothetical protein
VDDSVKPQRCVWNYETRENTRKSKAQVTPFAAFSVFRSLIRVRREAALSPLELRTFGHWILFEICHLSFDNCF